MTGKHYNWHRRWTLDTSALAATHDSGLSVRYVSEAQYGDMSPAELGGRCVMDDGTVFVVLMQGGDAALAAWLRRAADGGLRDAGSINRRLARLMREAGDLLVFAKRREVINEKH